MTGSRETVRLDKWLWHARFFRTRGVSSEEVASGHVRVNGTRTKKPAHAVGAGDTLTFVQGDGIRVIRIIGLGLRRGPAIEAQAMYVDLAASGVSAPSPLE